LAPDCFPKKYERDLILVRPILFHLPFGLPIYGYGAMLCLSVIVGRLLAVRLAERDGMDGGLMSRGCVWILASAFVGARLLCVVTEPDQFDRAIDVFKWWNGGVVAYGGFLGGLVGTIVFCRIHGVRLLTLADCAVPSLCLGLMLTRIGCLLAGCCFGQPWEGPWAVRFPAGSPAFEQQALQGLLPAAAMESLPVHPTQLYESLAGLALFSVVIAVRRRQKFPGQALAAFFLGYAVLRYAIEVVRADSGRGTIGPFSTSQFIAMATFLSAAALSYVLQRGRPQLSDADPGLNGMRRP
jgi:phosphatidylglycerol---prolipoprotein diacylglyceryl transferase